MPNTALDSSEERIETDAVFPCLIDTQFFCNILILGEIHFTLDYTRPQFIINPAWEISMIKKEEK
jgi:hypothetical protein